MKLTIKNRLKLCWEILTIRSGHTHCAQEKALSTFQRGYAAGFNDAMPRIKTPDNYLAGLRNDVV